MARILQFVNSFSALFYVAFFKASGMMTWRPSLALLFKSRLNALLPPTTERLLTLRSNATFAEAANATSAAAAFSTSTSAATSAAASASVAASTPDFSYFDAPFAAEYCHDLNNFELTDMHVR